MEHCGTLWLEKLIWEVTSELVPVIKLDHVSNTFEWFGMILTFWHFRIAATQLQPPHMQLQARQWSKFGFVQMWRIIWWIVQWNVWRSVWRSVEVLTLSRICLTFCADIVPLPAAKVTVEKAEKVDKVWPHRHIRYILISNGVEWTITKKIQKAFPSLLQRDFCVILLRMIYFVYAGYIMLYYVILLYCVIHVIITTDSHTLCKQCNAKTQDWCQVKLGIEALNGLNDAAVHAHDVATAALDEMKEAILDVIFDVISVETPWKWTAEQLNSCDFHAKAGRLTSQFLFGLCRWRRCPTLRCGNEEYDVQRLKE